MKKTKEVDPTKSPQPTINPNIPPLCAPAVNKLKGAHPGWTITKFAAEFGILPHLFCVGSKGGYVNYQLLGKCKSKVCNYKHVACTVADAKQKEVSGQIMEGLKTIAAEKITDAA